MLNLVEVWLPYGAATNVPNKIVVHSMGEFIDSHDRDYSAWEWLQKLGLSAHALVRPDGSVVLCRKPSQGAYHAKGYNTGSLGIEFLVPGVHTYTTFLDAIDAQGWVTEQQLQAGIELVGEWMRKFDIEKGCIVQHSQISPGRKWDPGKGFPWSDFLAALKG